MRRLKPSRTTNGVRGTLASEADGDIMIVNEIFVACPVCFATHMHNVAVHTSGKVLLVTFRCDACNHDRDVTMKLEDESDFELAQGHRPRCARQDPALNCGQTVAVEDALGLIISAHRRASLRGTNDDGATGEEEGAA
jgi:hypothetical protein